MIKSAIFNILGDSVIDKNVLDCFAGSGSLGLEALSRGAKFCLFIDKSKSASNIIHLNLKSLKFDDKANILTIDLLNLHKKIRDLEDKFDISFFDPPYFTHLIEPGMRAVLLSNIIAENGILIVRHHKSQKDLSATISESFNNLSLLTERRYSEAIVKFYQLNP
jgi:16S rRNA (guanine(966)-N(2))-methyltransferase RsmD